MPVVTSPSDVAHPFTVADLEGMPDDGRRYELIDGELLVSPAPGCRTRRRPTRCIRSCAATARLICG